MEDQSDNSQAKNRDEEDDEDSPQLSEHALAALQEFYAERMAKEQQLAASLDSGSSCVHAHVEEDWQLSQFWYEENTSRVLAEEVLQASQNKRIACISCPTLFSKLMELKPDECQVTLLEYDRRFEIYGDDFVFYDYNKPLELPEALQKESFDMVIADPPFLSEECLRKTAQTIKLLAKGKILLCTGAVMEDIAFEALGVKPCQFVPKHTRNLANEFRCYVNYKTGLNSVKSRDT